MGILLFSFFKCTFSKRVHFVSNGENYEMHRIDWCEGGLQLADNSTNNFSDNYLKLQNEICHVKA